MIFVYVIHICNNHVIIHQHDDTFFVIPDVWYICYSINIIFYMVNCKIKLNN